MRVLSVAFIAAVVAVATADHYHRFTGDATLRNPDAFNTEERTRQYWENKARDGILKRLQEVTNNKKARNIIMFLGDGMSVPTLAAARTLKGQRETEPRTGEETEMFFETFPTVGLSKTYCLNQQIADSACTATSYLTGIKNNYGAIGVTGDVLRGDCEASLDTNTHLDSIAVWAIQNGKDAGIVTTTRITHASPAGVYARVANRDWESDADVRADGLDPNVCTDIAHQLINTSPGNQFKVILGGGRREFLPNTTIDNQGNPGARLDNRNLIQEWEAHKGTLDGNYQYIEDRSQLMSLRDNPPDYLLGLFSSDHLPYHMQANEARDPTLAELTEVAINSLNRNENGFFLFVESGRIDHAHHDSWPQLALDETLEMDKAIQKAVEILGDDTLIVVTADHSHVMSISGYTRRGTNILGVSDARGDDNIPYMTLSYINGPGARTHINNVRPDVTQDTDFMEMEWKAHAEVPRYSETHGGDDVAVMAYGPQHHMFTGLYEQNQIPVMMAYAACIGPGLHAEVCNSAALHNPLVFLYAIVLIAMYRAFQ